MARAVRKFRSGGKHVQSGCRRQAAEGGREAARSAAHRDEPSRASLYDEVTSTIIAQLESGVFPWVQPWTSAAAGIGLPRNAVSGRPYSGINVLILWGAVIEGGYASQNWLTFRQALAAGGCVRKGERGRTVFYADRFIPKSTDAQGYEQGHEQGGDAGDAVRSIPFLKRFTVFNVAQVEGLPERFTAAPMPLPAREPHLAAEALIAASGAEFRIGGARAYYVPSLDYVQVPPQPAFTRQIDLYDPGLVKIALNGSFC